MYESRFKLHKRFMPVLITLLFVAGLAFVLYPRFEVYIQDRRELALLEKWGDPASLQALSQQPAASTKDHATSAAVRPQWQTVDGFQLLGTIEIPSLDLKEPIVQGSDAKALKRGAGTVVDGRLPGEPGNFVLAGHRSLTFGRHFNRLGELQDGDIITLQTTAGSYRYRVSAITIVKPDDLSVLANDGDASELTLVTCHPRKHPTHRLIIRASLLPNS